MGDSKGGATKPSQIEKIEKPTDLNPWKYSRSKTNERKTTKGKIMENKSATRNTSKCLPKSKEIPTLEIKEDSISAHIQHMKELTFNI